MVGVPTFRNLKLMVRQNIIHNFPVRVEYIEIAEKIFCPDMYTLKGRTTRQIPKGVVDDFIEIPQKLIDNNQELILCMNIVFINQQDLLSTIDKYIRFLVLYPLANRTK